MRANLEATGLPRSRVLTALVTASILLTGCSGGGTAPSAAVQSGAPEPAPAASESGSGGGRGDSDYGTGTEASPASPAPGPATVQVGTASGPLGTWLTGAGGLTLYIFKPDGANTSACLDDCAQAWPPLTVGPDSAPAAGDGVTGELTTFARPDGTLQIAYDGAPLYYFANDTGPGDTNGQGLGDVWFVAEP